MEPAPVDRCRVLELGCADGCNLLPMALFHPESEFVGIDLAGAAIREGQSVACELGLSNLSLREADIASVAPDDGPFDYIIAAGVFSWVPPGIRQKILEICRDNLAPRGVAYISYNAYPGWHLRQVHREMVLYHVRRLEDPETVVKQGRALLRFLLEAQPPSSIYHALLERELKITERQFETVALDELGGVNRPFYFHEFIELAGRCGMQYLSEAEFSAMGDHRFPPETREKLHSISGSLLELEQYMDFISFRQFRQTLLCRQDVQLSRKLDGRSARKLYISAEFQKCCPLDEVFADRDAEFVSGDGARVTMNSTTAKAALHLLATAWPRPLGFEDLLARTASLVKAHGGSWDGESAAEEISELLLGLFSSGIGNGCMHRPLFTSEPDDRPAASRLARLQAAKGKLVTNLRHRSVYLTEELPRYVLTLLDGTRDRQALQRDIAEFKGSVESELRSPDALETILQGLARSCMLMG
jgi:methyltransferase-like protein/trans-aconitate methyltransferase